jgi:hypothetical protein
MCKHGQDGIHIILDVAHFQKRNREIAGEIAVAPQLPFEKWPNFLGVFDIMIENELLKIEDKFGAMFGAQ